MEGLKTYFSSINPVLFNHVSGKPKEFIRVFRKHNFLSEEAFARKLCGKNYNDSYYREWKSRTIRILQALAIISNAKGGSLVKKNYDKCQKNFLLGQKFITQGQRKEGMRLIKQAYGWAVEYDFPHLACELASILHHDYSYYHRNKRMAEFYAQKVKKYLKDYTAEKEAEYYFFKVVIEQMHASMPIEIIEDAVQQINSLEGGSIKFKVYEATVNVLYGLYTGKYEQIITSCTYILQFFKTKNGVYPAHYLFFLLNRGTAQTATARYADADTSYLEAERYVTNSPYNTYTLQFYKTLNALHAGQYQLAYDLCQRNKRCRIEDIRQHFAIVEAYLCFLAHTGYLKMDKIFRMGKYLNDTFKAQEDKQGGNINILIAELLVYLARDRGKFIDRIESIQHYSYRHLKGEDTKRAKWFLKILCMMAHPKVNFHPVALRRKVGKYIDLLESHPVRMGENFAVEIIPFHDLLSMIEDRLMRKVA